MLTVKDIKDAKERADKLAHPMFVVVSPISGMETAADQICKVLNYVVSIDYNDERLSKELREMVKKFHDEVESNKNKAISELINGSRGGELN